MLDRVRAVRNLHHAMAVALAESPDVAEAKRALEECGMFLTHFEVDAHFSLASIVRQQQPRESDADFLKKMRIDPNVRVEGA
jgi:hypothetical protein